MNVAFLVRSRLTLTPKKQALFGRNTFLTSERQVGLRTSHSTQMKQVRDNGPDVRNSEPKNEGPDHAEDELQVPVDNVCSPLRNERKHKKGKF